MQIRQKEAGRDDPWGGSVGWQDNIHTRGDDACVLVGKGVSHLVGLRRFFVLFHTTEEFPKK